MMELSSSGNCGWLDSLRDSVSAVDSQRVREVLDSLGIGEPRKQTLKVSYFSCFQTQLLIDN